MKTINYGIKNDCKIYAIGDSETGLTPLTEKDLMFVTPDYCVTFDSGVYPVTNLEQYICDCVKDLL